MPKQPMRIFEGTTKPHEPFWRVVDAAEAESGEPEIWFYGYISEYTWFEDDITPNLFKSDLMNIGKGGPVTIRIHSGGGEVFAASAIRSMIMEYPGKVTTRIEGLCASAATYVAMAGDVVLMHDSAWFMVHDPWTIAIGSVSDLKAEIKVLESIKAGIIETYQGKTKLEAEQLAKMMSAETWLTAQEAKAFGFVDEVISQPMKSFNRQNAAILNALRDYVNVPPALLKSSEQEQAIAEETLQNPPDAGEDVETERELKSLRDYLDVFA